jgi:uncharacterized protein YqeY
MGLKETIAEDMKNALRSGDKAKLGTLRFLLSQIKNAEIDRGGPLTDEDVIGVISREVKKLLEAADEFEKGGSAERAAQERAEAELLRSYLPPQLSEEEIERVIETKMAEIGASSAKDLGPLMRAVMEEVRGRADGKLVNELVRRKLGA